MGRSARARESQGKANPTPERWTSRVIVSTPETDPLRSKRLRLIEMSDRSYVMDARGCVRRVPPAVLAEIARRKAEAAAAVIPPALA